jgi:hypothetical protein
MPSRNEKDETAVRAHDLICSYLEFQGLTPNKLSWNPSALADNPPRLIRYQRLGAILAAFGIKTDLASFDKGKFINEKDPAYEALLSRARKECPDALSSSMERRGTDFRSQLGGLFRRLLEYRMRLEPALSFARGTMEASGLYVYALEKAETLNRAIRSHLGIVDDLLAELISPTDASIAVDELARRHGYPLGDRFEIDLDWL